MVGIGAFLFGALGGLLLNVVRLAELAVLPRIERPPTLSDPLWVFRFLALPAVGGALAYVYQVDGVAMKPLLAMNIGISAPLILNTLAAVVPKDPGKVN